MKFAIKEIKETSLGSQITPKKYHVKNNEVRNNEGLTKKKVQKPISLKYYYTNHFILLTRLTRYK